MTYQAVTSYGSFDIGEFQSIEEARAWARQRFNAAADVLAIPQLSTEALGFDPSWFLLAGLGLLLLISSGRKK